VAPPSQPRKVEGEPSRGEVVQLSRSPSTPPRGDAWSRDGQSSVMATGPGVSFSQLLAAGLFSDGHRTWQCPG
jgi:hypothetical protein